MRLLVSSSLLSLWWWLWTTQSVIAFSPRRFVSSPWRHLIDLPTSTASSSCPLTATVAGSSSIQQRAFRSDDGASNPNNTNNNTEIERSSSSDIRNEENAHHNNEDDDDDDFLIPKPKFSKVKWKKKRYLMMQDVKKHIQQNHPQAPKKAEDMVRRMMRLYENSGQDDDYRPTLQCYNLWIHALAKSNWDNAGQLAEQVMEQMQEDGIVPDVITYTSVMDAHAKSQSPEQAENVLFRLLDEANENADKSVAPKLSSSITCDTILNAWAQQGTLESAHRAQLILFRLEEWQRNDIRPTKISYATVMNAWAKVGSAEAAEQAEGLLRRMMKPDTDIQPDNVVFNVAINAWATSKDREAGEKAFALLQQMKKLAEEGHDTRPDIVTYNTVLSAWSHSGNDNAPQQTEKIVQEMQDAHKQNSNSAPSPNTVTYNTILNAWAKSTAPGAAERAQNVLNYMIKSGREEIAPDVTSFTSVMDAWAKSREPQKSTKCRDLLDQMLSQYQKSMKKNARLRPTIIPYNTVLNACAFSAIGTPEEEQREALQIAVKTFSSIVKAKENHNNIPPDTVTYGNMLKCLVNLMPTGDVRSNMALQIFQKCCDDGLVGTLVWNEIRRAVPAEQLKQKLKLKGNVGVMQLKDLPRRWRNSNRFDKNAPKSKRKEYPSRNNKNDSSPTISTIVETSAQSGRDI